MAAETGKVDNNDKGLESSGVNDSDETKKLKEENIKLIEGVANNTALKEAINGESDEEKQKAINEYLKKVSSSKLSADFFHSTKGKAEALSFLEDPSASKMQAMETVIKNNDRRIASWEQKIGKSFNGKSSEELAQFVGGFYEEKIIGQTPAPGKDPFKKIGEAGKAHFRWTEEEATKNLQWKKSLVDSNANPMAFLDWIDNNLQSHLEKRDGEILNWAEKNVRTAESNPKLFSPKYVEKLKEIAANAKAGKPNNYPIELLRDFDTLVVKEQAQSRLDLEKEAGAQFDKHAKLIGTKNVMKWKGDWLKNASIKELQDWFKAEKSGQETGFQKEIKKLQEQEARFKKELDSYPAEANKKEYLEWFYSVNGDEREQCFEYLKKQKGKLDETQKEAIQVLSHNQEYLSADEATALHLPNLSKLSNSDQAEKVEAVKRSIEKNKHLIAKFKAREQSFGKEIADFEAGTSQKELAQILKPIIEIHENLQKETACPQILDALKKCEQIRLHYEKPENVEKQSTEADFVAAFMEDHTTSIIIQTEIWNQKKEQNPQTSEEKTEASIAKAAEEKGDKKDIYREALVSHAKDQNPELINDDRSPEQMADDMEKNIALSSDTFQASLHENPSFQDKYREAQNRKEKEILSSNDDIAQNARSTGELIRLNLDDSKLKVTSKETAKQISDTMRASNDNVQLTDQTGQNLAKAENSMKKKEKITKKITNFLGKFFGEKEAQKFQGEDQVAMMRNLRLRVTDNDNDEAIRRKMAEELFKQKGKDIKKKAA